MELKIGKVALMTGLSSSGIRFLEDEGIIVPTNGRKGKYRNYDIANVSDLLDFRNYRECGFSLEETSKIIKTEEFEYISDRFDDRCDELVLEIMEKQKKIAYLRNRQKEIRLIDQKGTVTRGIRPSIVYYSLNVGEEVDPWPQDSGFEIPYTDSCLIIENGKTKMGIGCYAINYNMLHSGNFEGAQLIKERDCLEMVVRVNDDLSIDESEYKAVFDYARANGLNIGKGLSKRIVTVNEGGKKIRYDRIWFEII